MGESAGNLMTICSGSEENVRPFKKRRRSEIIIMVSVFVRGFGVPGENGDSNARHQRKLRCKSVRVAILLLFV